MATKGSSKSGASKIPATKAPAKSSAGKSSSGKDDHWMQKAFANAHGQFRAKAKKAGKSVNAFASKVTGAKSKATTKTKRQANLVKTVAKINRAKKGK